MSRNEQIRGLIWNKRNEIIDNFNSLSGTPKLDSLKKEIKSKFDIQIEEQDVILVEEGLLFTNESFYFVNNNGLTEVPFYNLAKAALGSDGCLELRMRDSDIPIIVNIDRLIPEKSCELFNQIVDAFTNKPVQEIRVKSNISAKKKRELLINEVIMIAILGVIVLALSTCIKQCAEDSRIERERLAVDDSLEWELLKSEAELAEVNRLTDETQKFMDKAEGNKSGVSSTTYDDELAHIVVSRKYQVNSGKYFGCKHLGDFHKLINYAVRGDNTNFNTLRNTGLLSGEFIYFDTGEIVTLRETNYDKTEIRVNRAGQSTSYWTVVEAIE